MKYDFTRCDNFQFTAKVQGIERKGYLKVLNKENVYMFYSDGEKAFDTSLQFEYALCNESFSNMMDFNLWAENYDLEITPRNPETYNDWKVGDRVVDKETGCLYTIAAKLGDIVFLLSDNNAVTSTCTAMLVKYYALVLTDYEKELIHAQEPKKKKCRPFKNGDRVLVRDNDDAPWQHDIFYFYEEESSHPYGCQKGQVKQCIPFNEHTWKLLGTTDEYKEE